MQKVKVLVVEDETYVAKDISFQLTTLGYEVCGVAKTGKEALRNCEIHQPDLVLMDIKLKGNEDGIETAIKVADAYNLPIIYLSDATDQETLQRAKNTRSHSFLPKPVTEFTLNTAIEFAIKNHLEPAKVTPDNSDGLEGYVFIRIGGGYKKLPTKDILWFQASGAYCQIKTADNTFTQSKNMREVSEYFDPRIFVKIHKSFIVNITTIDEYEGSEVTINGQKIPIGKTYLQNFKRKLKLI